MKLSGLFKFHSDRNIILDDWLSYCWLMFPWFDFISTFLNFQGVINSMVDRQCEFPHSDDRQTTRDDNILDLTPTTNPDLISDLETHTGMSDHNAVTYNVNLTVKRQKKPDRPYRKGDLEGVKWDLGAFRDNFLSEDPLKRSVDDNWNLFKDTLVSSMKKNIINSRWNLPWTIPQIKRLCRKKKRAWDAGKHNRNSHSWKRYIKLNK